MLAGSAPCRPVLSTTSPNINSVSQLTAPHGPWHEIPRRNSSAPGPQSAGFLLKHPQLVLPQHIHSTTLKSIAEQPAHWILNRQHTPWPVQLFRLWCLALSPISSPIHILSSTHRTFASSSPKFSCVAEIFWRPDTGVRTGWPTGPCHVSPESAGNFWSQNVSIHLSYT